MLLIMIYYVEKYLDGFSVCFRQFKSNSHCRFLHGYGIAFRLHFRSYELNECSWVWDFGWLKDTRFKIEGMSVKEWFSHMFDHTVVIAETDPYLSTFKDLYQKGLIQLRIIPIFSCEALGEYILNKLNTLIMTASNRRVTLYKVDVIENNKNVAKVEM